MLINNNSSVVKLHRTGRCLQALAELVFAEKLKKNPPEVAADQR